MVRILALDLGQKRTGVAYFDEATGIPLPLATIAASGDADLLKSVFNLLHERSIDRVIIGLQLLPSGSEGSQALWVKSIADRLEAKGYPVRLIDERYSTPRNAPSDPDASAAVFLLQSAVERGLTNS